MVESIFPLKLADVTVVRRGKRLIGPVNLTVDQAGVMIVIGPNGSGKTTLLRLMHGLERRTRGTVEWQVPEVDARQRQAYVFQSPIMMRRTVQENLAFPLVLHGTPRKTAMALAGDWAARIGLSDALARNATLLSGGEKQKLALARALIREPDALFLDEPCANLDGRATREIEEMLQKALKSGTRIVMATHDMGQARRLASEVVFMLDGRIHEFGPSDQFFANQETSEARAFLNGDIVE